MKTIKHILPVVLMGTVLASCDDLFVPADENLKEVEAMYTDASYASGILGNAYILMPYANTPGTDYATDDAVCNDKSNNYLKMATGAWSAQNDPTSQWQNRLNAILYTNIMVNNAEKVTWSTDSKLQTLYVDLFKGDACGMRALQLFYLLRAHAGMVDGVSEMMGVPIIREFQGADADFNQPRATFRACIDSIMADINRGIEMLPYEYGDITDENLVPAKYKNQGILAGKYSRAFGTHQKGKINGMILRALRAQVALYAASPAFAQYSGITMEQAAQYAAELINTKEMPTDGYNWFANTATINGLGKGENSSECIWQSNVSDRHSLESSFYPPSIYGEGRCNPSQNLVDAFPMTNGYPISDSRSGYDQSAPYASRDARLAAYIIYDGQAIGSGNSTIITGTYGSNNNDGLNYREGYSTRTGYYMRKLLRPDVNLNTSNTTDQKSYDARIRWTEIFLAYAEAANEAAGPDVAVAGCKWTAKSVLKALRERANICSYVTTIKEGDKEKEVLVGLDDPYLEECAQSKEKMRELIRNERRLELCFENHRFYDLRRWQVDLSKLNETIRGIEITDELGNSKAIDNVETRSYKDYQFYGPIPYSEVMKYDALQQNKGW